MNQQARGIPVDGDDEDETDIFRYDINFYPADFTVQSYFEKYKANPVQLLIPTFQRSYVWDLVKASRLVESFLLGLPVPQVFLYKERGTNYLFVIDGQQRIMSAIMFLEGIFEGKPFKLKGVSKRWEGRTFEELDDGEKILIKDSVLRATVVQQVDPEDHTSIYLIFERLNTGGMNLNPMEVRRCINEGPYIELLTELNEDENWRNIIGVAKPDKRFKDLEWLLRIAALREGKYQKPMKTFLTSHLEHYSRVAPPQQTRHLNEFKRLFIAASEMIIEQLGATPFHPRRRLNVSVLDACMVAVMIAIKGKKKITKAKFAKLMSDEEFILATSVSTSDEKVVEKRFELAIAYLAS